MLKKQEKTKSNKSFLFNHCLTKSCFHPGWLTNEFHLNILISMLTFYSIDSVTHTDYNNIDVSLTCCSR